MRIIYSLIVVWILVWQVQLSHAVREGTANAKVMIQRYEREGDFAKAALWHEAAADSLKIISIPMTEIQIRYYLCHGKNVRAERSRGELADIKKRRKYHLKAAKTHWEKSETEGTSPEQEVEREKISQFISTWAQIYPNRFYHYGIYPSFFRAEQEIFKREGDYAAALNLEADAAEMCADQYNEITVAYFRGVALNRDAIGGAAANVEGEAISPSCGKSPLKGRRGLCHPVRKGPRRTSPAGSPAASTRRRQTKNVPHRSRVCVKGSIPSTHQPCSKINVHTCVEDCQRRCTSTRTPKRAHRCARIRLVSRVCVVCQLLQSRLGQSGDRPCR